MAVLKDRRHERIAQLLAVMKTPEQASAAAGYDTKAKSFGSNARKRACRKDIKARVAEIQEAVTAQTIIDAAWIRAKIAVIGGVVLDPDDIKANDVIAALNLLAKMTPGALVPQKIAATDGEGNDVPRIEIMFVKPAKKE